jgi:Family of unknown function (DUF6171)
MSQPVDDWRKLFGAIDVSAAGVSQAPQPQIPSPAPPPAMNPAPTNGSTGTTPGIMQRAATFGTSMAKFAAGGFHTTAGDLQQQRLVVCRSCQQLQNNMCLACGCIIPLKVKMPHETCPLGRWPA